MAAASISDCHPKVGTKLSPPSNLVHSLSWFLEVGESLYSPKASPGLRLWNSKAQKGALGVLAFWCLNLTPSHPPAFQSCQVLHMQGGVYGNNFG